MRSYRPSGSVSAGGFLLMLILAVISGLIVGAILWAVDNYAHFYLVIAFPLLGGVIAGAALSGAVRSTKVRSPLIAGLMGIIAGLIMYGTYHLATYYVTFKGALRDAIVEQTKQPAAEEDLAAFEQFLYEDSNIKDAGFVGYIQYAAQVGFTITNTSSSVTSSKGTEIQGNIAYAYWAIEILLAALAAGGMAWSAARQPFDENNNVWYGPPQVFAIAPAKSQKALVRALKDGSFQEAGALLTRQQIKYPRIELWVRRSPVGAGEDVLLLIKHLQRSNRPRNVKEGMVSPSELDTINKAVDTTAAPNPVVSKI